MYRILLVDDREVFRRQLKRNPYFKIQNDRFVIDAEASDGVEALAVLRKQHFDVVLTDIKMPLIDGLELLKIIQAEKLCSCTVLLSEYAEFSYAKAGIINGAFDYIVKPVTEDKIRETFERVYHFLNTTQKSRQNRACSEVLADFICSGDREAAENYLQKKNDSIPDEPYHLFQELCSLLFQKIPYLENFLLKETFVNTCINVEQTSGSLRLCTETIFQMLEPYQIKTTNPIIKEIQETLLKNPEEKYSIQDLSQNYYLNAKYLGHLFKQETGMPFSRYLAFLRIQKSEVLLHDKNLKIYEAARLSGYEDVEYFSKLFKQFTGISPRMYREQC